MAHLAQEWLNWENFLIFLSSGKKVSALVILQTRWGLNVFHKQSCTFRAMDWVIHLGFFIPWLLRLSENGFPLATFLNQCETLAQDSISQKGFTACTWPFVRAANIVSSSDFFMPGRSDKQAEGTQKKRNRLEAGGFFVLLSKTTYICDGPGLNNLLWAEVLKFILFRIF